MNPTGQRKPRNAARPPLPSAAPRCRGIVFSTPLVRAILDGRKTVTRRLIGPGDGELVCPFGAPGDLLWVRETFDAPPGSELREEVVYRADYARDPEGARWRSSRFMPRWASRLTLEIASVRAEHLQDITPEDILAEGVVARMHDDPKLGQRPVSSVDGRVYANLHTLWASAWNSFNGKRPGGAYELDPRVWRIGLRRLS